MTTHGTADSSPGFIDADWPAEAEVVAGCSVRSGGISTGRYASLNLAAHVGDDADAVAANRSRFVAASGLPAEPGWLNQVHGNRVAIAGEAELPEADAVVSPDGNSVIAVLTADCLPILLCSRSSPETAALHCGWRSLAAGIVANTLERMRSPANTILAWLGPAISKARFEVGDEVREQFVAGIAEAASCFDANDRGRWQADLYGLATLHLRCAGIEAVYGGGYCTYDDRDRFFSYRRDGQTGRMATCIARR